jgi:hypothetical protein
LLKNLIYLGNRRVVYRLSKGELEKRTTLTYYSYLAKKQRYGKAMLIPERIDFIKQSNSQTLRMCFDTRDWDTLLTNETIGAPMPTDEQQHKYEPQDPTTAHIHSIHVDQELVDELQRAGFMFGVKLSFGRRFLCFFRSIELFQSLNKATIGCLDDTGKWHNDQMFFRNTLSLGRLKLYMNKGLICCRSVLGVQGNH